jgi:hypothetical protein
MEHCTITPDQLIAYLTGGMLLVAAVQALLFLFQLKLMRKSLDSAVDATKVAQNTLALMKDTAQRQLRAYISVTAAKIEFPEPGRPKSTLTFKNAGQTPAHDVQIWIHQWAAEYPLDVTLPTPDRDFVMARNTLGAGAHCHMTNEAPRPIFKSPYLDLVGTSQGTIYVYGEISYLDVFGERHVQRYRLMYGGSEPVVPGALKPCASGNDEG